MSEYTFAVGGRVQTYDEDDELMVGVLQTITPNQRGQVMVLWDDSDESEAWYLNDLEPEGTVDPLETEFRQVCSDHTNEIDEQLVLASEAIEKAVELSEKYGLPFSADVSFLPNSYLPFSFIKKFRGLDSDFVYDMTGVSIESAGWEHSDVC